MEVGDKVKFTYGKNKEVREGTVFRLFPKNVHIEVDFPGHKGRILHRKRHQLTKV